MKITINIIKKHFFVFILLILISAGIFIAFAYNSDSKNKKGSSPAIFGHSADEVEVNINGETKTLQEALDSLTERINNPNSNNLEYLGHFSGFAIDYIFPFKYRGEKNYKYIIIADVDGGGPNERLTFYIYKDIDKELVDKELVLKEGTTIAGNSLPLLGGYDGTKVRLQLNINKDISGCTFGFDCAWGECKDHPPHIFDVWVYRIDEEQKVEQFSFPKAKVDYTFNIS